MMIVIVFFEIVNMSLELLALGERVALTVYGHTQLGPPLPIPGKP